MNIVEPENVFGLRPPVLMVILGSLVLGGLFFAIGYIVIKLGRRNKNEDATQNSDNKDIQKSAEEQNSTNSESAPGTNNTMTNSKRARKKRREAQQEFNHSWMVGALKGHTAPVRDINFSSNGKFLASCAEDCGLAPEEKLDLVKSSKSKASASSSSSSSLTKEREDRAPLSRRQRKNLTRASREQRREHQERDADHNVSPSDSPILPRNRHHWLQRQDRHYQDAPKKPNPKVIKKKDSHHQKDNKKTKTKDTTENKPASLASDSSLNQDASCPSMVRQHMKHVDNLSIEHLLQNYVLNEGQLLHGSYPVLHKSDFNSVIICSFGRHHHCTTLHRLNANAREFVPRKFINSWKGKENENDSGNGSGSSLENSDLEQESSSDSDKSSDISESSVNSSARKSVPCILPGPVTLIKPFPNDLQRRCSRCSQLFYVDSQTGEYLKFEQCVYHWGKRRFGNWECCSTGHSGSSSPGCVYANAHVWSGIIPGATNGPLEGYVVTQPAPFGPKNGYGVYAIDCEMCFTKNGLELTKVSVVSMDGNVVYDQYVKPESPIIDYNTRFSGITAYHLYGATKTLKDVQIDLLQFVFAETILVGHGLENDLRALRIVHKKAVDTSIVYLNEANFLSRKSLKFLAHHFLNRSIQFFVHDSVEDARMAMDLMLQRLHFDNYNG